MSRKLIPVVTVFLLVCCVAAPSFSQRRARRKTTPRTRVGAALGERLKADVSIKNFEFRPKSLVVKPGTVVTWTNDAGAHTVVADDGSFSSPTLSAGQTFSHKFTSKGTHRYYCSLHGGAGGHDMAGAVVVQP